MLFLQMRNAEACSELWRASDEDKKYNPGEEKQGIKGRHLIKEYKSRSQLILSICFYGLAWGLWWSFLWSHYQWGNRNLFNLKKKKSLQSQGNSVSLEELLLLSRVFLWFKFEAE